MQGADGNIQIKTPNELLRYDQQDLSQDSWFGQCPAQPNPCYQVNSVNSSVVAIHSRLQLTVLQTMTLHLEQNQRNGLRQFKFYGLAISNFQYYTIF